MGFDVNRDSARLTSELEALKAENHRLRQALQDFDSQPKYDYDADGLRVWGKNTEFMRNERFATAYLAGINTGHKFGQPGIDIGIQWRVSTCCWASTHGMKLDGDFVECGVNTGIMSMAICHYVNFANSGKKFYLFDTFAGIPIEQTVVEERENAKNHNNSYYTECCYELTKANFASLSNVKLVKGKVPDTLNLVDIDKVSYLHIDMNVAYAELEAIKHFWPKLVSGAIVVLDDYGWTAQACQKRVLDEFVQNYGVEIYTVPTGQGILIKP